MTVNGPSPLKPEAATGSGARAEAAATIALSVIIPAFNEERRLPPTLIDMVDHLDGWGNSYEIIVVDDGSTDGTGEIVEKFARLRPQVRLVRLPVNTGKGAAVKTGMLAARGARRLFADADGATPFEEFTRLMGELDQGADVAIGSRALASGTTRVKTVWYRRVLGRIFNGTVNVVLLPGVADTQCGFKLFTAAATAEIFRRQTAERFGFDVEILYIARRLGLHVVEVPINWTNVPGSKVNLLWDSAQMLLDVLRVRFRHRGVQPLERIGPPQRTS